MHQVALHESLVIGRWRLRKPGAFGLDVVGLVLVHHLEQREDLSIHIVRAAVRAGLVVGSDHHHAH
jgi:hypothetical protein